MAVGSAINGTWKKVRGHVWRIASYVISSIVFLHADSTLASRGPGLTNDRPNAAKQSNVQHETRIGLISLGTSSEL